MNPHTLSVSGEPETESWITFGGLNEKWSPTDSQWVSMRIAGSFHWQAKFNALEFKGIRMVPEVPLLLTDTGTSITYLLPHDFDRLMPHLCPHCAYDPDVGVHALNDCFSEEIAQFEPIWFQLESHLFEMPVQSYLYVAQKGFDNPKCYVKIARKTGGDFGTLGVNFLENYVQYYSVDGN